MKAHKTLQEIRSNSRKHRFPKATEERIRCPPQETPNAEFKILSTPVKLRMNDPLEILMVVCRETEGKVNLGRD